jgi:hypothetical protein
MHHPGEEEAGVMEVKVLSDYNQDALWKAYLLSIPSLWITAWVVHRLYRMKKSGVHWLTNTPSHTWPNNGESE